MTGGSAIEGSEGGLGALLLPLRIPLRALSSLTDIVTGTIDELLQAVLALQPPLERMDEKVGVLEESLGKRLDGLGVDLGARISRIEKRLVELRPLLERIAGDLEETAKLLPDPSDGPLARLRDTFSSD